MAAENQRLASIQRTDTVLPEAGRTRTSAAGTTVPGRGASSSSRWVLSRHVGALRAVTCCIEPSRPRAVEYQPDHPTSNRRSLTA